MDWSLSISHITKDDEGPSNLAMAPLKINGDKKLYGTLLPVGDIDSTDLKRISIIARDIQLIVLYDQEGKSAGVRRPNSKLPMDIDGVKRKKVWALQDGTTMVIDSKTNRAEFSDDMNFLLDKVLVVVDSCGSNQATRQF